MNQQQNRPHKNRPPPGHHPPASTPRPTPPQGQHPPVSPPDPPPPPPQRRKSSGLWARASLRTSPRSSMRRPPQPVPQPHARMEAEPAAPALDRKGKIYSIGVLIIALGLAQLSLLKLLDIHLSRLLPVPSFVWMTIALIALCIMVCTDAFNAFPLNLIVAIVVCEAYTLCLATGIWPQLSNAVAAGAVFSAIIVSFALHVSAAMCPLVFLPGLIIVLVVFAGFIVVFIVLHVVIFFTKDAKWRIYVNLAQVVVVMTITLFTATMIHERRPDVVLDDYLMYSLFTMTFFMILLAQFVTIYGRIYNLCDPVSCYF